MSKLSSVLCFRPGSLDAAQEIALIQSHGWMEIQSVISNILPDSYESINAAPTSEELKDSLDAIASYRSIENDTPARFSVYGKDGVSSVGNSVFREVETLWIQHRNPFLAHSHYYQQYLERHGFMAAYEFDDVDTMIVQSCQRPSNFPIYGLSYDGETYFDEFWQENLIDIRRNPGRLVFLPKMYLGAQWRMWFSIEAMDYMHIDSALLLNCSFADRITQEPNGNIGIQLFESALMPSIDNMRQKQREFRLLCRMDDLEDEYGWEST